MDKIRVTVWNEFVNERSMAEVAKIYPNGIHNTIAEYLRSQPIFEVRTGTFDEPEHGLAENTLNSTDVLVWWSHSTDHARARDKVSDTIVDRIHRRVVLDGMGLILLHSGVFSQISRRLIGTTCQSLRWRIFEDGERERLWVVSPGHPIVEGIGEYFELEQEEMYGEPFDIPAPDDLVFVSWFEGGEIFRSGCCFQRGMGKIFYFRPGHETFPIYHDPIVQKVISNAIRWAAPVKRPFNFKIDFSNIPKREALEKIADRGKVLGSFYF